MPVPTAITDLNTSAISNYPSGSDSPNTLDDVQRAHASFIAQLWALVGSASGSLSSTAFATGNLTATGTLTGSTGVMNIGSQIYKDSSGLVGIGTGAAATTARLAVKAVGVSYSNAAMKIVGSASGTTTITHVAGSLLLSNDGASDHLTIDSAGNVYGVSGTTAMTDGFFYIPAASGAPSGVPTIKAGHVPIYYDASADQFYAYNGGWKKATLT